MSARLSGTKGTAIRGSEAGKAPQRRRKPGRVPTACAECRRLKLRCNRQVPCEKCESRGCATICPDGVLTRGGGNRLMLANTEQLHDKIDNMTSRIRQLERALCDVQSSHPLLRNDLVLPLSGQTTPTPPPPPQPPSNPEPGPSQEQQLTQPLSDTSTPSASSSRRAVEQQLMTVDEKNDEVEACGTLISTSNGGYLHLGSTARPEYLMRIPSQIRPTLGISRTSRLSKRIINASFFDSDLQELDDNLGQEMYTFLPQFTEAESLGQVYLEYGMYLYISLSPTELSETIAHVYRTKPFDGFIGFEYLSLLFSILALGATLSPRPDSSRAQEYFYLSRAALSLSPARCGVSLVYIQAIIHMAQYLDLSNPGLSHSSSVWLYVGYAARLGQSVALQLNNPRWDLPHDASLRRCRMFWRLFVLDTWTSFYYGRPLVMSSPSIDCPFPKDIPTEHATMSFDLWNSKYASLVYSVITVAFGPKHTPYSSIIDLDRKIRDFHVPTIWTFHDDDDPTKTTSEVRMQRYFVCARKEIVLLSLHRPYLVKLLSEKPIKLERHRYRASATACYRSAWRLIHATKLTFAHESYRASRISIIWSHCLSATIVMSLLVTNDPQGPLAPSALRDLGLAVDLFENAAASCPPACQLLNPVRKLLQTAREAAGQLSISRVGEEDLDAYPPQELERLAGMTSFHDMTSPHMAWSSSSKSGHRTSSTSPTFWQHIPDILEEDPFQDLEEVQHRRQPPYPATTRSMSACMHPTLAQDLTNLELGEFYTNLNSLNDRPSLVPFTTTLPFIASTIGDVSQDTVAGHSPTSTGGGSTCAPVLGERVLPSGDHASGMDQYCQNGQQMSSESGEASGIHRGGLLAGNALLMLDPSLQSIAEHLGFFSTPLSYTSQWFAPSQLSY